MLEQPSSDRSTHQLPGPPQRLHLRNIRNSAPPTTSHLQCCTTFTTCNAALLHRLQHCTAYNAAPPATLHHLQCWISCKTTPHATPHHVQHPQRIVRPEFWVWDRDFTSRSLNDEMRPRLFSSESQCRDETGTVLESQYQDETETFI